MAKINHLDHFTLLNDEWLITNGLGGYSSTTLSGTPQRRQHGLLVASLPAPLGRTVMLSYVDDAMSFLGETYALSMIRQENNLSLPNIPLVEFKLENGLPVWIYAIGEILLEKRAILVHRQNTLHMTYHYISGSIPIEIKWQPYIHFRASEHLLEDQDGLNGYQMHVSQNLYEIEKPGFPKLKLSSSSQAAFTFERHFLSDITYDVDAARGYAFKDHLQSLGYFSQTIHPSESVAFTASTESWKTALTLSPHEASGIEKMRRKRLIRTAKGQLELTDISRQMILAADQFIITPTWREEDSIRLEAAGEEVKSIIAGYPWFTDWGRDTMISLEGLTLVTGRYLTAESILKTFAYYIKGGLIPNMFPDGEKQAVYNTADATLWFFHAVDRYIHYTNDTDILDFILPKLAKVIEWHIKGTHFGIKMDSDGLLTQGEQSYQLTWMDAKVDDWVVTPRRGKAVEINALWYNALKLFEKWTGDRLSIADQCYESFNQRFWYKEGNYLFDVVDNKDSLEHPVSDDPSLRPNQLLAISLDFPVLAREKWSMVFDAVKKDLLTPYGLRTLSPSHRFFKPVYDGDLRSRDAAYHQGTVWPWLIGPYIDVWLKIDPQKKREARDLLKGLEDHATNYCKGTIGEIFDACEPFYARGCFAQAWSVAEFLRCLAKTKM
ncbi:MAG: amylo-alpha-1,6-glucosidase [Parachlamydiaceae bacterium]